MANVTSVVVADHPFAQGGARRGAAVWPRPGMKVANSKGVPGSIGCLARSLHDGQIVLLCNWHVLFGEGASEGAEVWLVDEETPAQDSGLGSPGGSTRRYFKVGKALYGRCGRVRLGGVDYHVDCAVSSTHSLPTSEGSAQSEVAQAWLARGQDVARADDIVTKSGAATGLTTGVVVEVDHTGSALLQGRWRPAPRQILVRAEDGGAFSAEGDSGAVLVNSEGRAVGLLWGTNTRGEGVACPIAPVLYLLNITLDPMLSNARPPEART